jgi:hypothetical protein
MGVQRRHGSRQGKPEPSHYEYQLGSVRDNRNRNDIAL